MTKYVECWGADKPFANIAESTLAKNIELTVSLPYRKAVSGAHVTQLVHNYELFNFQFPTYLQVPYFRFLWTI